MPSKTTPFHLLSGRRFWLAGAASVALAFAACGGEEEPASGAGDGAPAASETRELTVYSGRDEALIAPLLDTFTEETGIRLKVRYGDSAEMAATIREEGDRSPADVYFGQDAGALGALAKASALAPLPQTTLDKVAAPFRSDDGLWVGTSGRVRVIAYDKTKLQPAELPASVLELTDPRWKGKVGWAPTNASFQAFITAMRKVEGQEATAKWLQDMRANDVQAYEKNGLIRDAIAAGEVEVGLINHYYVVQQLSEEQDPDAYPVALHFPQAGDVGSLVNVAGAAVLASSEHRQQAQQLVDFLLGAKAQEYFRSETAEYPLAAGVSAPDSVPAIDSIEQPQVDLSDIDDLEGTLQLLEQTEVL